MTMLLPPWSKHPDAQTHSPIVSTKYIDGIFISHHCVLAAPGKRGVGCVRT